MTPHPEHGAAADLAPDADRALAEFLEHLRLERGRSPHTVRAYRADLTGLLAKIKPAVTATAYSGERTSKNYAFVDAVARRNVEITIANIRKDSPVLAGMESSGAIKIAGAMYSLQTGVVDFFA